MSLDRELGLHEPLRDKRHETVLTIVRTANVLSGSASNLFRRFALTEAQFNVLFALKIARGDITQVELGRHLVVTRASVTSVVDKLESKDLIRRVDVPGDRRMYHLELTCSGRLLINKVEPLYRKEIHDVLEDVSDEDCQTLMTLLDRARARVRSFGNRTTKSAHTEKKQNARPTVEA